jgi:hypothetical protein
MTGWQAKAPAPQLARTLGKCRNSSELMEVGFDAGKRTVSAPRVLFQTHIVSTRRSFDQYDVAPDGRFLMNSFLPDPPLPLKN